MDWARRIATDARVAAGLFALALLVRAVYLLESASSPVFAAPIVDSHTYDRLAAGFAASSGLTDEFFWQPFFYPAFLALCYSLGSSIATVKLLQAALGAVTAVLTFRLGYRFFDRTAGIVAGAIVALYGPLVFFDGELLATGWACFWSVGLLLLLDRVAGQARSAPLAGFGACAALSVLTRPTFLPFCLFCLAWLVLAARGPSVPWRRAAVRVVPVLAGFAIVVAPVALLSRVHTQRLSFLPASAGVNLYVGNNPDSARTVAIRPGWDWEELTRRPERHVEHKKDTSSYFRGLVVEYVRSQPLDFLRGLGAKTLQLLSSRELPRNTDVYTHREWSRLLAALVWKIGGFGFPFGVVLPLAAFGLVTRRRRVPLPLVSFLVLYSASVVLVFVTSRYRTPLVPVLATLAAAGALDLVAAVRRRAGRRLLLAAVLALTLGAVSTLPGPFVQEATDYRAEIDYFAGSRAMNEGDLDRAIVLLSAALARVPDHSDANNTLGLAYARANRPDLALEHFARAVRGNPRSVTARDNYARALAGKGDLDGALRQFRTALEQDPWNADVLYRCGRVLGALQRHDEAIELYERALRVRPGAVDVLFEHGRALYARGDLERAAERFRDVLARDGLHRPALELLGATLARLGRGGEIIPVYRAALVRAQQAGDARLAADLRDRLRAIEGRE